MNIEYPFCNIFQTIYKTYITHINFTPTFLSEAYIFQYMFFNGEEGRVGLSYPTAFFLLFFKCVPLREATKKLFF